MPLLAREPDLYPETLLDHSAETDRWWAIYTLARREKELMRQLRRLRIGFYSPIYEQAYRSPSGRLRTSFLPLFPSYVFIRGDEMDRYHTVSTGCVSRCIEVPDPKALIQDLQRIRELLASGLDITAESQLIPGRQVRVKNGPLAGQIGTVHQRRGQVRLLVSVNFLQQGASADIEGFDLEPWN